MSAHQSWDSHSAQVAGRGQMTPDRTVSDTLTREQRLKVQIARLQEQYPALGEQYWAHMRERNQMQWQIDDLRGGIAEMVGEYRFHAKDEDNARLAEMVERLNTLVMETFR